MTGHNAEWWIGFVWGLVAGGAAVNLVTMCTMWIFSQRGKTR